uniref:Uncharacterized protein n=1 Tax=Chromera velia CCMP2878 TaxID=1169474 RepID=A0A0G4FR64_9ALVE|eukprot:Cvel_18333.t1-p1 / transcript=Cvel_18333.t1 / gene=Cvel_18333 / organism=Chromera_velia_CCMP2878 / gene_product=hypothetical protein / transcript_product=hypothetical protein / location=Cvel_scaffold1513:41119-44817(-) / protein_length=375 / sequence_SO=supercontig / SO=protein_coding / is_pseudo=false
MHNRVSAGMIPVAEGGATGGPLFDCCWGSGAEGKQKQQQLVNVIYAACGKALQKFIVPLFLSRVAFFCCFVTFLSFPFLGLKRLPCACLQKKKKQLLEEDDDEDDEVGEIFDTVMQISGNLFKMEGPLCTEAFNQHVAPVYSKILQNGMANADYASEHSAGVLAAICAFADAVDCGGPQAIALYGVPALAAFLRFVQSDTQQLPAPAEGDEEDEGEDEDDILRCQASAFGLGCLAQRAPEVVRPRLSEVVSALNLCFQHPRLSERRLVIDCAVCALTKIISQFAGDLGVPTCAARVQKIVSEWLPVTEDEQEAWTTHDFLFDLLEAQRTEIINPQDPQIRTHLRRIFEHLHSHPELLSYPSRHSQRLLKIAPMVQ